MILSVARRAYKDFLYSLRPIRALVTLRKVERSMLVAFVISRFFTALMLITGFSRTPSFLLYLFGSSVESLRYCGDALECQTGSIVRKIALNSCYGCSGDSSSTQTVLAGILRDVAIPRLGFVLLGDFQFQVHEPCSASSPSLPAVLALRWLTVACSKRRTGHYRTRVTEFGLGSPGPFTA